MVATGDECAVIEMMLLTGKGTGGRSTRTDAAAELGAAVIASVAAVDVAII